MDTDAQMVSERRTHCSTRVCVSRPALSFSCSKQWFATVDIAVHSFPPKALRQRCDASCAAARRDQSREVIRLLASSFAPAGRTCAPPCLANEQEHVSRCRLVLLIRLSHVMYTYERHSPCDRTCRLRALSNKFCDPASNQCAAHRHAGPYTRRDLASGSSPPPVLRPAAQHGTDGAQDHAHVRAA